MKNCFLLFSTLFLFLMSGLATPAFALELDAPLSAGGISANWPARNVEDFLALTPKKVKALTGKKLNLKEVLALKAAQKKVKKAMTLSEPQSKSQLTALLLCIFLGWIGIHRFYLGYVGIGIFQLITFGCCGIWSLIDLIMILTGRLRPKSEDVLYEMDL